MPLAFGRVPHPPHERRIVSNPNPLASFDQGYPRDNVGSCVHRMDGTLDGTDSYFRNDAPPALTDYGIGGALDAERDGTIYMWNDPTGSVVPSANGPASGPDSNPRGDGPAFLATYGIDAVNSRLVSIELSGCSGIQYPGPQFCADKVETPVTPAQFESLCQLIAYWHDQAQVPWDLFPVNPASGVVTQMQHYEFSAKDCPYPIVKGMTGEYQARVREIMRAWQVFNAPTSPGDYARADLVRTTEQLDLRSGPGASATLIKTIPAGANLVLIGPSEYRDGEWWYKHRSHYGDGWSVEAFTKIDISSLENVCRNPTGSDGPLTGITRVGAGTIRYTDDGLVEVNSPYDGTGVQYDSVPNLSIPGGRSLIAIWDQLGLSTARFEVQASSGATSGYGPGTFAVEPPDRVTWSRNFSSVVTLRGTWGPTTRVRFWLLNKDNAARVFYVDNVYVLLLF